MIHLLLVWFLSALAIFITAAIVPGFTIKSYGSAMIASIIIGLLNMTLKPLLILLTLPINIVTLGLFTFVVNAIILRLAAALLSGFSISGWLSAIIGAVILAIIQGVLLIFF